MHFNKSKTKPKPKSADPIVIRFRFEAIGTSWQIEIYEPTFDLDVAVLRAAVKRKIGAFDRHYSRFRDDSLVAAMSRKAGRYKLPADAQPMVDLYQQLYEITNGALTPLIGQLLSDAGYDAKYSLHPGKLCQPPQWEHVLSYDFPTLTVMQPVLLDFGAAGKGYIVDQITELISRRGISTFCVNAGGDIVQRSLSNEKISVGLEHPDNSDQIIGVASIVNQSLCGSAINRRVWGGFHHIIDPFALASPRHIKALWVAADTALLADALSTALFFVSPDVLARYYTFEYALIRDDYSLEHSTMFPAEFFTETRQAD